MKSRNIFLRMILSASGVAFANGFALPAYCQSKESSPTETGDIIVTARRVEERLQDVPISMTVFNATALSRRNVTIASDLGAYTPSLSVNQQYGPEKSSYSIRGFNQDLSTAPTVGVYFADVVGVRAQGGTTSGNTVGAGSFIDLQNVQVLKGPQGTLFGRNTTGGAVLLVPRKPSDKLEGHVEVAVGNFDMWRLQGVLNVPVSDSVRVRASVERQSRDGYMHNVSGTSSSNYNDINYFYGRLSIVVDFSPTIENYTIGTYSNSFTHGYGARLTVCNNSLTPSATDIRWIPAGAACAQLARQNARGDGPLDVDIENSNPYLKIRQWQVINTTRWTASDNLTIKNIASYGQFREKMKLNQLNSNLIDPPFFFPLPAGTKFQPVVIDTPPGGNNASESTFTDELQFQGSAVDGRLKWQAGGYLEFSRPQGFNRLRAGIFLNCTSPATLQCTDPLGFGQISDASSKYSFDNHGLYTQATFAITRKISLTGGFRYTFDKINAVSESTQIRFLPAGGTVQTCYDLLHFHQPVTDTAAALLPKFVTNPSQCHYETSTKSNRPTWMVDLEYRPTDTLMVYGKYSRGYRQGGVNLTNVGLDTWQPEKVDAYEIGAKTSFDGSVHGYFNVAAFYNNFRNQQIFANLIADTLRTGISGGAGIINAGKSRIQGIEVDASLSPLKGLTFDLGYTFLDTKVISITPPAAVFPYIAISPNAREGQPLTLSPKNRLSLSGTYSVPLGRDAGKLSLGATYVHTDSSIADTQALPVVGLLPATDLLNLNVTWENAMGGPVDLAFFATNVTNQIYPVNVNGAYTGFGYESLLMAPPRMWGLRVRYKFGE
ncbi:MAG: TonB-dependent receptor [Sphingomonadales bacterium]|nr:TonB-dependent receptor [Sphingomonadales bacterium]